MVRELDAKFRDYACQNPEIHFSAGIAVHKAHTPIDHMADTAEAALESSKDGDKQSLTVFGQTVKLDRLPDLLSIRAHMKDWLDRQVLTRGMFYRLNTLVDMAGEENRLVGAGRPIYLREMSCTKWRAMLSYSLARNINKRIPRVDREKEVREITSQLARWLSSHGADLRIPLWHILYNIRRA